MSTLSQHDIAGQALALGDHCLVVHNNRMILARVCRINADQVTVQPLASDAGGRRSRPPKNLLRRNYYNVYRVSDPDITMAILRGAV